MENLINSSIQTNITNFLGQNSVKLPVEIFSGDLAKLPLAQNINITIELPTDLSGDLSQAISRLNIQLNNETIELFGKVKLPNLINNKTQTTQPNTQNNSQNQNIQNLNINAKIINKTQSNIELNVSKINNQNPVEFLKANSTSEQINNQKVPTEINSGEKLIETNILKQNFNAEFVAKDFTNSIKTDNPDTAKAIVKLINNLSVSLKVKSVTKAEIPQTEIKTPQTINSPLPQINEKSEGQNVEKLYQNIKSLVEINSNKPINAEVVKELPNNRVMVKSDIGNLIINNETHLKIGDKLEIEINKLIENNKLPFEKLDLFDDKFDIKTPKKLESLDKIITHLKNSGDSKTAEIIQNKIPDMKKDMLSNIIKYVKATKHNDATQWLGKEVVETIKEKLSNGVELLNNLEKDIEKSSFRVEHAGSEWKIINIPFIDEDALVKIRAIIKEYKKYKDKKNQNKKHKEIETGARFIIDTDFSMLGAFQFDGLSFEEKKKFDLIIRTEKQIDNNLVGHIINIFKTSLNDLDFKGNVHINQKDKFIIIEEKNIIDIVEETNKLSNQGIWV